MQTQKPYHEMDDIYLYLDTPELEDMYNRAKPLADAGDPNAACVIGWYHTNMGTTANIPWGIKYLVRALDGDYREEAIECLLKRANEELLLHGDKLKDMLLFISLSDENREEKDMVNALLTLYYVHHVYFVDDNTKYFDLIGEKYYDDLHKMADRLERDVNTRMVKPSYAIYKYLSYKEHGPSMAYLCREMYSGDVIPQNMLEAYYLAHKAYKITKDPQMAMFLSRIYAEGSLFAHDWGVSLYWAMLAKYCGLQVRDNQKDMYHKYIDGLVTMSYVCKIGPTNEQVCDILYRNRPIDIEEYISNLPDPYEYIKIHQRYTESQPNVCKKDENNGKTKSQKKQARKKNSSS